ncbi:MAG: hypothetical protein HFH09_00150 [Bacilli bacterium]|nr:hypothetical protein [Bacilli bacterium]
MKKLILLTLCSLFLFTGCSEKKPIDNNQENKEPAIDTKLETSNNMIKQLNQLLSENGSKQQFTYLETKENTDDETTSYQYQTEDKMNLSIAIDVKGKVYLLSLSAASDENDKTLVTEDYKNTRLFLLKLDTLHIQQYQYNELQKCAVDMNIQKCAIDNFEIHSPVDYLYTIMIF